MLFSKPCQYAIRGLAEMARTPPGTTHTVAQLAKRLDIPQASLAKVFQRLVKGGVLAASAGRSGGYFLIKNPAELSLNEVRQQFEVSWTTNVSAPWAEQCQQFQRELEQLLSAYTFKDLTTLPPPDGAVSSSKTH